MDSYKTAEVAAMIGVHPNTVRLYEAWGLIPVAERKANGYRVFNAFHIQQFQLARTAFQIEVLQGGLRKKIVDVVKLSAQGNFDGAILLTKEYIFDVRKACDEAEDAICIVQQLLSGPGQNSTTLLTRKEASEHLGISMDTLRNWERNGLLTIRRKQNGYHVYSEQDIKRLKIIRSLRCANYSLEAILRMLQQLSKNPNADIKLALNTPRRDEDIISVCDKLMISLSSAEKNALKMLDMLQEMKKKF